MIDAEGILVLIAQAEKTTREKTIKECMATVKARLEPYDFVAGEFALEALSALLEPKP